MPLRVRLSVLSFYCFVTVDFIKATLLKTVKRMPLPPAGRSLTLWIFIHQRIQNKKSHQINDEAFLKKAGRAADRPKGHAAPIKKITLTVWSGLLKKGSDILSHITAVPSAQSGLTSLFGMGRGEPRRNNHLKSLRQ